MTSASRYRSSVESATLERAPGGVLAVKWLEGKEDDDTIYHKQNEDNHTHTILIRTQQAQQCEDSRKLRNERVQETIGNFHDNDI